MRSYILLLISLFVIFPAAAESDFDKVCTYFEKLDLELKHRKMSQSQKADFINNLVKAGLKVNSSARESWAVIVYAVPEERYEIYKSTASELLKVSWRCDVMEKHIATTGE